MFRSTSENTELAIVEGQGALNNMHYSGVTLGLMHGCMPDYLIFTHEPKREMDVTNHPIPDLLAINGFIFRSYASF